MTRAATALLVCLLAAPSASSVRQTKVARPSSLVADVELIQFTPGDLRGDTDETWLAGARQMLERTLGVAMTP